MKRIRRLVCLCLSLCILLPSCRAAEEKYSESFFIMDTVFTVTLYTSYERTSAIFSRCRELLEELDALWSRTVEQSDPARFRRAESGERVEVDARTVQLMQTAMQVSKATDGAFDVTVAPLITLWQTCEAAQQLPDDQQLNAALEAVRESSVEIVDGALIKGNAATQLDFGGIGKGAATSCLIAYLETCDLRGAMVSFGSNVAVVGQKPDGSNYRIALRDPTREGQYATVLTLKAGEILSVSGDYERFYTIGDRTYHHILDPKTGYPSNSGLTSVAVICRDGATADALSTALLVMGEERALAFYRSGVFAFEAVLISSDGTVTFTDGLSASGLN